MVLEMISFVFNRLRSSVVISSCFSSNSRMVSLLELQSVVGPVKITIFTDQESFACIAEGVCSPQGHDKFCRVVLFVGVLLFCVVSDLLLLLCRIPLLFLFF